MGVEFLRVDKTTQLRCVDICLFPVAVTYLIGQIVKKGSYLDVQNGRPRGWQSSEVVREIS